MIKYSITMGIRLVCIFVCFLVPGYWAIIPAVGAIVLPYIAVVLANVSGGREPTLVRPDQLALPATDATSAPGKQQTDAEQTDDGQTNDGQDKP